MDPEPELEIAEKLIFSGFTGGRDFHSYIVKVYSDSGTSATEIVSGF